MLRFVWCGTLAVGVRRKGLLCVVCVQMGRGDHFFFIYRRLFGGLDSWIRLGSAVHCGVGGIEDRGLEAEGANAVLVGVSFVRMKV
jgi:hypothetical protein